MAVHAHCIMTKRFPIYLIATLLAACLTVSSCNDENAAEIAYIVGDYYNTGITAFSLGSNEKILRSLDSVFFSIDLVKAEVFNADSLPKGTDVSRMIVNVTGAAAKSIELSFKSRFTGNDTVVNLTENPSDSINFAAGPVKMTVTSYNEQAKRDYTVKLNVHTVDADTLYWDQLKKVKFPVEANAQRTAMLGEKLYTLLTDGSKNYLAVTSNPESASWTTAEVTLPAGANINTLASTDNALFLTDNTGLLYTSTDGKTWTSTSAIMNCVYGGYGDILLGARNDNGTWIHTTYPASSARTSAVPAGCPVSGTSQLVMYQTKWSTKPMAIMIGGVDATGSYTGESWAYDGEIWSRISTTGIDARAGMALIPYSTPRIASNSWRVTYQSALIAMGGIYSKDGTMVTAKQVYISYDFGITWKDADTYLQFPSDFPAFSSAQAFVKDYTLTSRAMSDGAWTDIPTAGLPAWATPVNIAAQAGSRVSKPVTSWECPYIFLFGGYGADGNLIPYVTRGVINRFTFQPLY